MITHIAGGKSGQRRKIFVLGKSVKNDVQYVNENLCKSFISVTDRLVENTVLSLCVAW